MNEVVKFYRKTRYSILQPLDVKGKCRPFMFCFEKRGNYGFCTNHTKDVFKDMKKRILCGSDRISPDYTWIRLNGKAVLRIIGR